MRVKRRNKIMIFIGFIFIFIGIILLYWNIPYSPFKKSFDKNIQIRLSEIRDNGEICTEEEINKLPEALKKHLDFIGLAGSKKYNAINVLFHDTKFVFDSKKNTILNMDYDLWLLCDKPFRSAFCKSNIFGIPFDGIDYSTDDKIGGMKGMLGKTFQIFDEHNEQMYKASLISWLAEGASVNPAILLSEYIQYEEIDSTHVKANIRYNGVEGNGTFHFDESGKLIDFQSDERQVENIDGVMTPIGWRAEYANYQPRNGILIPGVMRAIKEFSDKQVVYFESNNFDISYYK